MTTDPLLTRLQIRTPALVGLGRRRRLPLHHVDVGYLVHCYLGELFRDIRVAPFHVTGFGGRRTDVLAYTDTPSDGLRDTADAFAAPELHAGCVWDALAQKAVPALRFQGRRIGFTVRVCPVVRTMRETPQRRRGAEVDAFLAACSTTEGTVDRYTIYRDWLHDRLEPTQCVEILDSEVCAFMLDRVLRRDHQAPRKSRMGQRPNVTIRGNLRVTDGERFGELLLRGVGRHRAFGFGMILIRPPDRSC